MDNLITSNIDKLKILFEQNKVQRAFVFGSAVAGDFNEKSDLDFLVRFQPDLDPLEKGELWWNLHDKLRDFLNREVDIVTENSLKNPYFIKELDETKRLIYEKQS